MKKRDLVDYILKVVYGEIKPPMRNSCGRPNAREFDMQKYLEKINKNKDLTEQLKGIRLNDDVPKYELKLASPKDNTYIGEIEQRVVFIDEKGCYLRIRQFVESENDIKVDKQQAEILKLENFDVVEVIVATGGIKIISVNGKEVLKTIQEFNICNEKISAGSRKVFHLRTKEKIKENIEKIKISCQEQMLRVVTFGREQIIDTKEDCFVFDEKQSNSKAFKKFMTFVEYCKKLVFENKTFLVIIQEMRDVQNILKSIDKDVGERIKKHLNEDVKNFVKLGNILLTFTLDKEVIY